jgi:hypothetical protein
MTIHIDESKLNGLNAIVAKENAIPGAVQTTPQEYLELHISSALASYDQQIIDEEKKKYDGLVTLAASLPDDKKAQLIAMVQQLSATE